VTGRGRILLVPVVVEKGWISSLSKGESSMPVLEISLALYLASYLNRTQSRRLVVSHLTTWILHLLHALSNEGPANRHSIHELPRLIQHRHRASHLHCGIPGSNVAALSWGGPSLSRRPTPSSLAAHFDDFLHHPAWSA
jgi:hypothetical protein